MNEEEKSFRLHLDKANREGWGVATFNVKELNKIVGALDQMKHEKGRKMKTLRERFEVLPEFVADPALLGQNKKGEYSYSRVHAMWEGFQAASAASPEQIDMVLHCPKCFMQHIDTPENARFASNPTDGSTVGGWTNPPHRSHLCKGCGHIWRPADVPTNGVAAVKTRGKNDSPIPQEGLK